MASVYGKAGRADTATDPAPLEMFETTIRFKPRDQWRPGMTQERLIAEMDSAVSVPGLRNARHQTKGTHIMKYRKLGNTGTVVSTLALGTMYFGDETAENDAFAILDAFLDAEGRYLRDHDGAAVHRQQPARAV